MSRSIRAEAFVALVVVAAAGLLAHLKPGAHEQAGWPFAWRLNTRSSGPLFVPAVRTSFYRSPGPASADSIVRGAARYAADCASCHGGRGHGDGRWAHSSLRPAPDLTEARLLEYADGDLFWHVGHASTIADEDRWDLVDYLRALNRGEFVRTAGRRVNPVHLPLFNALCSDGSALDPDLARGKLLRLEAGPAPNGPLTVAVSADLSKPLETTTCTAQPEMREALGILLGLDAEQLAATQFLVDTNGWLRARWRSGEPGGWGSPEVLEARLRGLGERPLAAERSGPHVHRR